MKALLCLLISMLSTQVLGQYILKGVILDSLNNSPIIGVTINEESKKSGTISNEDGEFEFIVNQLPARLVFSHVSYKKITLEVRTDEYIKVITSPAVIQLPEFRTGDPTLNYIRRAIDKLLEDTSSVRYFKAFYQDIVQSNENYKLLNEILMNVSWNAFGVQKWQPYNMRYAMADRQSYFSNNQTFLPFLYSSIIYKHIRFPINNKDVELIYSFKIKHYLNTNTTDETVVISCTPKSRKMEMSLFDGDIFIDIETNNIVKMAGKFTYPNKNKDKHIEFISIDFMEDGLGQSIPEKVNIRTERTLSKANSKIVHNTWLYFFEEIRGFGPDPVYPGYNRSDLEILEKIPYNEDVWQKNRFIKQPNLSKEVLNSFEKGKAGFRSNY
ncbi:carboxypeptidase-like regulatory domain-containing protein [Leadbetterella sp. DM7]|uniref:carboxypeptidase-like regulatory domain-containing protein n=1 Tax=Leadbetterella sp. DM7 TaxID=3235085 RepID=UPI00349E9175